MRFLIAALIIISSYFGQQTIQYNKSSYAPPSYRPAQFASSSAQLSLAEAASLSL
jgi:hypothetical protein